MSIDEQLDWLLEGAYFADEGGLAETEQPGEGGLRKQMRAELKLKLTQSAKTGVPLRVYLGVDPTSESLHIGHMIPVMPLRKFQALGHQVIFLIGDYTATVGDPSDQTAEREQLSHEHVLDLARFYTDQAFRLLDREKTEIRHNGDWLAELRFAELAELASLFPLSQVIARQDFRSRLESGAGVRLHECLYTLMQGFDAFALNCDVQVGGYDQHFNLLSGRIIQEHFARKLKGKDHPLYAAHPAGGREVRGPHVMLTGPLLMGTDGRKMSKSWGNTIDVLASPEDMYGKVMRISDEIIGHYIDIAVDQRQSVRDEWKAKAAADPMGVKKWVASQITGMYHGEEKANEAAAHFQRTVQEKTFSDEDIEEVEVPEEYKVGDRKLVYLMKALDLISSRKEGERLITGGGVKLNEETVTDRFALYSHESGAVLQVSKRKVVKLV